MVAVEPSTTMIEQRTADSAPVVRATAMALPFKNDSFDAALAVLTVHHWPDQPLGLAELRRVARRRVVVLTWDPTSPPFWLTDYFPELLHLDRPIFPTVRDFERALGPVSVATIPVPHDCSDGFLGAHWQRPSAYLDARVRGAISTFSKLSGLESGLRRLRADLGSGEWRRRYGGLLDKTELDLGYELIVAGGG
ncbi:MAG: methyltransferase domain-containing protein [Acidobacteria bacterium]|nr:methyltransferase domain-containing protein [Acidobacteriota bacterium]